VGDNVTIGHRAVVHACTVMNNARSGSCGGAGRAVVEEGAQVCAGALVPRARCAAAGWSWGCRPAGAQMSRELDDILRTPPSTSSSGTATTATSTGVARREVGSSRGLRGAAPAAGERVLYKTRLHWGVFIKPALVVLVGVSSWCCSAKVQDPPWLWMFGAAVALIGCSGLRHYVEVMTFEFAVTTSRLIFRWG